MKKTLTFWLMALLIGGLSMAVTSCKDDDKDKNGGSGGGSGEEPALTPSETVVAKDAYTWLNILTDLEGFTDDWASKTYEPTIGIVSQGQPTARVVIVADLDMAKNHFSGLANIDFDKLSTSQTATIEGVGSLTWTPSPKQNTKCSTSGNAGYAPAVQFSSNQGYWVIRMKRSKDLCGSSTDKYHNMTNVKETYLYNKDV